RRPGLRHGRSSCPQGARRPGSDRDPRAPQRSGRHPAGPFRASLRNRAEDRNPGEMNMPMRIVLADDHAVVRHGLRALLESAGFQITGEAADGQEVVRLASAVCPDLAILDISMPLLNGLDAARQLKKALPNLKVILLTRHDEPQYVTEALRAGVRGYVLKSQAATDLVQAVEHVGRGGVYLSPNISRAVVESYLSQGHAMRDPLTPR